MNGPIRVLCVFSTLNRGGAETMCMNLYRHIDRNKVQFDFVKHTEAVGDYEEEIGVLGGRIYAAPRLKYYNLLPYLQWWKKHLIDHPEHQIIHGHFYTIAAFYLQVARNLGRVTIAHAHCCEPYEKGLKASLRRYILKQVEKNADYCFACSKAAGKWLFPNRKFRVLPNAVDSEEYRYSFESREKVRAELGLDQHQLVIGTVGGIYERKNPVAICKIFKRIYDHNSSSRLLWVGNGPMLGLVQELLTKERLIEYVIFTGVRNDVSRLLQAMDAFILPSRFEGLPVVLIEAQAAGLHCYCSDAITEEVNICNLCTFLPNNRYDKWAEGILSADLNKYNTSDAIVKAGYDIRCTSKRLEKFYRRITEKGK